VEEHFRRRRKVEEVEMQISRAIAMRNPMRTICDEDTASVQGASCQTLCAWSQPAAFSDSSTHSAPEAQCSAECAAPGEALLSRPLRLAGGPCPLLLPGHFTQKVLGDAFKELGLGAEKSIEACLKCWREGKIGDDEMRRVFESFAGSSKALREHLTPSASPTGEVATPAQMQELQRMFG
jgi:hypothetical protein